MHDYCSILLHSITSCILRASIPRTRIVILFIVSSQFQCWTLLHALHLNMDSVRKICSTSRRETRRVTVPQASFPQVCPDARSWRRECDRVTGWTHLVFAHLRDPLEFWCQSLYLFRIPMSMRTFHHSSVPGRFNSVTPPLSRSSLGIMGKSSHGGKVRFPLLNMIVISKHHNCRISQPMHLFKLGNAITHMREYCYTVLSLHRHSNMK